MSSGRSAAGSRCLPAWNAARRDVKLDAAEGAVRPGPASGCPSELVCPESTKCSTRVAIVAPCVPGGRRAGGAISRAG